MYVIKVLKYSIDSRIVMHFWIITDVLLYKQHFIVLAD